MNDKIKNTLISCFIVLATMFGVSYLSAPLYNLFCKATGYDGTTQQAISAPRQILDRKIEVIFTTTVMANAPIEFSAVQKSMDIKIGEVGLAFFKIRNTSDKPIKAMALYNVTPNKVGFYFNKINCFCFNQQILPPNQTLDLPVTFFIDPAMAKDKSLDDISQIDLNYIFNINE